ncbi:cyclin-dependent protein kinase inhibitor SMR3-like [Sesamum indicum]|uniref:Cyclin-dependent protein kinase inhibitor SMR3-like n=1 Tax=Sesamum indicum TaxID=4182 RepID=A0A6I9TVL3_SESIN|nr:cyclin-dependent protein kinase inhibitor SMR3-like [Sesamum indicum]
MSESHTPVADISKQDVEREEERSGPRPELEDIEEGYQTPTSEEHRIPAVVLSCPPPAPKKRKRLSSHVKKVHRLELFQTVILDEDVRLILESIEMQTRVPPSSGPGSGPTPSPKKRRIHK